MFTLNAHAWFPIAQEATLYLTLEWLREANKNPVFRFWFS